MPGTTLDDINWDQILSGFTPAGQHKSMLTGAQVANTQLKTQQLREQMQAVEAAAANERRVNGLAVPPPVEVQQHPQDVTPYGPPVAGITGLLPSKQVPLEQSNPAAYELWLAKQEQANRDFLATGRLATSATDYATGIPAIRAKDTVNWQGVPSSVKEQQALQFQTKGEFPTAAEQNPYKDAASQLAYLDAATKKVARGEQLTPDEARTAQAIYETHFPVKTELKPDPATGRMTPYSYVEKTAPTYLDPLATRLYGNAPQVREVPERIASATPLVDPNTPPPPAPPAGAPAWSQGATVGLQQPPPAAAAAPPVAPQAAAAPRVEPVIPLQRGGVNVGAPVSAGNAKELRTEVMANPAIKSYMASSPMWEQAVKQFPVNTPQADIAIIYTLAKILDPDSVVREGEYLTFQKTGGIFDQLKGLYDRSIQSQAALPPNVRAGLADMGEKVIGERYNAMDQSRKMFENLAEKRYGLPKEEVIPQLPEPSRVDRKAISTVGVDGQMPSVVRTGGRGSSAPQMAAPAPAPAAVSPVDHDRVRQLLGIP